MDDNGPERPDPTGTWPASARADPQVALPARWRLGRLLGSGGQADVWLAEDLELTQWVAVKVFRSDLGDQARERLRREVRLSRTLEHPRLVRLFELIESDGRLAVVMEWLPGGSLAQRLEVGSLPIAEVVGIAEQVLDALAYLHRQGVVHRDVKPSNLLLDAQDGVTLADLGLARPLEGVDDLTRSSMTVGTPAYMSPEQVRGEPPAPAADLYGLGITLYQLLTGRLPFAGKSNYDVATQHLAAPVRDPRELRSDCPRWLARFVLRLLEKRPGDRWPDAEAAGRAFERRAGLASPRVRRHAVAAAGLIALIAAIVAVGTMVVYPRFRRGETVKVEAVGTTVRGLDARARETWHLDLGVPVQNVERTDLDGDGQQETVVAAFPLTMDRSAASMAKSEVVIVRPDGVVLSRIHPEDLVPPGWFPGYPIGFTVEPRFLDIAGDGGLEVVLLCRDRHFYPFALEVFWPRQGLWECALVHSGWFMDVKTVPGAHPPRLRLVGVNNRLCELPVVAEVRMEPPIAPSPVAQSVALGSPDVAWARTERYNFAWYTPLAQGYIPDRLTVENDLTSRIAATDRTIRVDRWGNPSPGPNEGHDLTAMRGWILGEVATLSGRQLDLSPAVLAARVAQMRKGAAPLLAEAPYRAIIGLAFGRALARTGDLAGGIRELRATGADTPYQDVIYRLAQLEAIAGNLEEAATLDASLLDKPITSRGTYDGNHLLMRVAIELRDPELLRRALVRVGIWRDTGPDAASQLTTALWARAHLWWDDPTEADFSAASMSYAPEGEAIACLARWRRARTSRGDPEAMRRFIAVSADAVWEGHLALAAAQLGLDRAAEAQATLESLINALEPDSRDDFMNRQILDLAEAMHAKAELAGGSVGRARSEAERLRGSLRPGLLPRILVDEVLRGSDAGSR